VGSGRPEKKPPRCAFRFSRLLGHSVKVLLDIDAKYIDGQQDIAKRRIADAVRGDGDAEELDGKTTLTDFPAYSHAQPHTSGQQRHP
jgi:hypothetical protein